MSKPKSVVYLYSEVMPYAIAIMRSIHKEFGYHVDCICWDWKKRTPFVPVDEEGITYHKRSSFDKESIRKFIEDRNPPVMYIVGRMDKLYMDTVHHFKDRIHIITGSDNQWVGNKKQWLAALLSPLLYKKYFEYFWVPGPRQYEYARRMGYPHDKILWNHLTADEPAYIKAYHENKEIKKQKYPHNIVFAGRFAKTKGLDLLVEAFTQAKNEVQNDWKLTLIGSGDLPIKQAPFIEIKGFMSGDELGADSRNWGIFCLPSLWEPWGVVIHEFTIAGLPILCSHGVGAADTLVINNFNGVTFKTGDVADLKRAILSMMAKSDEELILMGDRGHELSKMISPKVAAYSFMSVVENV